MRISKLLLFVALAAVVLPATAKHKPRKPPEPIPVLVHAKVLGIHCDAGQNIVEPKACQTIIDLLRASLKYAVINCPDVMDSNGEIRTRCLPQDDADLILDISEDYSWNDAYDAEQTDLLASLSCVSGHSFVCHPENPKATDVISSWTASPNNHERIRNNTLERAQGLVGVVLKLIDLRGGDNLKYKSEVEKAYGITP